MAGLREHYQKVKSYTPEKVERDLLLIVKSEEKEAINLNTDQLFAGETSSGGKLPDYSPVSVGVFGKRPGPWTLHNTGAFYRGFFMNADKWPAVFGSHNDKTSMILKKLNDKGARDPEEIFGLQPKNVEEFSRANVLPKTQEYFKQIFQV